jgi:methylated-DNA-[protein]-cysteine S-methyltransferase
MIPFGSWWAYDGAWLHHFDMGIGRCGIAWGPSGIIGVQLPEVREIDTRRRLFQLYPDARERRPPPNVQVAIEGIAALLRGAACDFAEVALDMTGIPVFNQRVYAYARSIPRGETRTYAEIASALRASGAVYSVAQAIGRNPFMIIVPCHRVLEAGNYADKISPNGGAISKRGCCRSRAPAPPPARRCSTCCCRLHRRARILKSAG